MGAASLFAAAQVSIMVQTAGLPICSTIESASSTVLMTSVSLRASGSMQ